MLRGTPRTPGSPRSNRQRHNESKHLKMRIGIFADSHDHLDNLRLAVDIFNNAHCEVVLFAGDLVSTFAVPPLRKLHCPLVACFGDNEGNKPGLLAGIRIVGQLGEGPFCYKTPDGTRFLLAHMERQFRDLEGNFEVAVYAHTHKPRLHYDQRGRLFVNPGETSGWTFGNPTVVILETKPLDAQIIRLQERTSATAGRMVSGN